MDGGAFTVKRSVPPQMMIRYSDDGHTWSNEMWVSLGKIGEYGDDIGFRLDCLGEAKARCYEMVITDPVEAIMINGYVDVSVVQDGW